MRGDRGPTNHASTVTLTPEASILTNITGYGGGGTGFRGNSASNPGVVSQYCNGSRVPPEFGGMGWQVPPGISDATVPNPIFNLTPAATVDEGNNWINISWGPLAMTNPATNATLGNYALTAGSPAINYVTPGNSSTTYAAAPSTDFFNNSRKANNAVDVGAVEFQSSGAALQLTSIAPSSGERGRTVAVVITGTGLTGANAVAMSLAGVGCTIIGTPTATTVNANCSITTTAALGVSNVTVRTPNGIAGGVTFQVIPPLLSFSGPSPALTTAVANTNTKTGFVTVTNTATGAGAGTFSFTAAPTVTKVATAGGTFSIFAGGTCTATTMLNSNQSCTMNVQYAPGGLTATATANVTVTGTGLGVTSATSANFLAN